jgi:glycerol uptake facilitator-like aquaporin
MTPSTPRLFPKLIAEYLGTTFLLSIVIGSGIMAERLAAGNIAIALLCNTLATVWGLYFLIQTFAPISGAHFNPAVSAVMAIRGNLDWRHLPMFWLSQFLGALSGAWLSHLMFELPVLQHSLKIRTGEAQWIAEAVATAGLLLVVLRSPSHKAAGIVSSYIGAAYWFTSSTSFANPAAAFGRMFSDTFAGIAPSCVPMFIAAQIGGAGLGVLLDRILGSTETVQFSTNQS